MIQNELFTPYQESLALQELGFDEPCLAWFKNGNLVTSFNGLYTNPQERGERLEIIKAPTFSQAFRFFRKCGLEIKIERKGEELYIAYYWNSFVWILIGEGDYE